MPSLEDALKSIDADFGAGSALRMGSMEHQTLDVIPSGSLGLDAALGVGGYPRGRIVEIYGPESAGKSSLCLHAVANAQKLGLTCVYIDAENSLDPPYASALGVDVDQLIVSQPSTGEQALEIVDRFTRTGEVGLVVVDSVAALIPRAELEGSMGDATVGLHARLLSQAMRKLSGPLYESNTCSIWINQIRERIGTMGYGPSETTTGGRALKFFSSVRMDVRRIATERQGEEATGNTTKVKVVKNKVSVPHKSATFTIRYGEGISRELELVTLGAEHGIIKKSGSWFSMNGQQLGQGAEKTRQKLLQDPALADEIEAKVREKLK